MKLRHVKTCWSIKNESSDVQQPQLLRQHERNRRRKRRGDWQVL